jgi:hypothetical protein
MLYALEVWHVEGGTKILSAGLLDEIIFFKHMFVQKSCQQIVTG